MLDIDLFNRGKLRKARYEYKRMEADRNGLRAQLEEVYSERAKQGCPN